MQLIENPILCMDELSKLFALMEAQETRLIGISHCIVPKEEEIPIIEPVFVPPNVPQIEEEIKPAILQVLMPVQSTKNTENIQDVLQINSKESVQQIAASDVPSLILSSLKNSAAVASTEQPTKEIISTPVPNPDENNIDNTAHTEKSIETIESSVMTAVPATISTIENGTIYNKLENMTVLETTPSPNLKSFIPQTTEIPEIPIPATSPSIAEIFLGEMESVSKSPEPDNYIYETFSPISPLDNGAMSSLQQIQRNEHLVLPEEPPEIPNVAAVPAA